MSRYYNKGQPKKTGKKLKTDSDIPENVQEKLLQVFGDEWTSAQSNKSKEITDFDEIYDLLHCIRKDKPNDWESDIFLPEFVSRILKQIGNFVSQYFQSRDFVENDMESEDPQDIAEAKASKKLLNKLLNAKDAHYFQKVSRLLMFVFNHGYGIIKGCYEQEVKDVVAGYNPKEETVFDDNGQPLADDGMPFMDPYMQRPMKQVIQEPIMQQVVERDTPTFDVYPIQNVYMSPEYSYTLQDKEYIIFKEEAVPLWRLEGEADRMGYFNLHILKDSAKGADSDRGSETYNKDGKEDTSAPVSPKFDLLERWGKLPLLVKQSDDKGKPVEWEVGIDLEGNAKKDAEYHECIMTTAISTGSSPKMEHLVRFQPSPYTKRPMVRFLCYVDALNDNGFGDGEVNRELQIAVNDTFNLMNYRTKLATTPAFVGRKFSGIPEKVKVSPENVIMMEDITQDLRELQISDNIQGSIVQNQMLTSRMDYAMATSPVTMGVEPDRRETATTSAIVNQHSAIRIGMKSMALEFIGFVEFYDMLLSLCNDFMLPQTLEELLGEYAQFYNPKREDKFKPVSQALETEDSKAVKIRMWDQVLGRVVGFPNPKTPMVVNYIMGQVLELMGGDFKAFKKFMFEEDPKINAYYALATGGQMGGMAPTPNAGGGGPQNQTGLPQGQMEQMNRANMTQRGMAV